MVFENYDLLISHPKQIIDVMGTHQKPADLDLLCFQKRSKTMVMINSR